MLNIKTLNKISPKGLSIFESENYQVSGDVENPDGIVLRSFSMHEMELPQSLQVVARAGAGVNNIPIDKCTEKGVVVFNTPGANANAVKELVLASLFLSSRKISDGIEWAKTLKNDGEEVPKLVEKGKSNFAGCEIKGKTLGVIGLGAIGAMVANAASSLEMDVVGYDPFLSVNAALALSSNIKVEEDLDELIKNSDYISIHVPVNDQTKGMINREKFSIMKKGVRILNFSRAALVNDDDILQAIEEGKVATYVTDFPNQKLVDKNNVVAVPHLGASTEESEENCATMAAKQMKAFLEDGNIVNSVNYPRAELKRSSDNRLTVAYNSDSSIVSKVSSLLENRGLNIVNMLNTSRGNVGYLILDSGSKLDQEVVGEVEKMEGVIRVRTLN